MTVKKETGYKLTCLSTDTKPTNSDYPAGILLIETDTGKAYVNTGSEWKTVTDCVTQQMVFWSDLQATVTIGSTAADISFPDVVVSGIPADATIERAVLMLKYSKKEDTSGSDNAVNGTNKTIRIKKSTGSWGTDDIVAIDIPDNTLLTSASSKEGGDIIEGDNDIKSVVDGDGTYNIMSEQTNRGDAIVVDGNNLILRDVQVGIKIYFKV